MSPPSRDLSPAASLALDLVRIIAAEAVLFGHAIDFFDLPSPFHALPLAPQPQRLAVVVFFLLSGFLIARSVDRRRQKPGWGLPSYLVERFARIYSGLIPALLLIAAVDALPFQRFAADYPADTGGLQSLLINLACLQEFPGTGWTFFGTGDPLWSMAVEWWLYVAFGLLVIGAPKRSWIALPLILVTGASVSWNLVAGTGSGIACSWFLGAGLWHLWRRLPQSTRPGWWCLGSLGCLALALARAGWSAQGPTPAYDLGVAILLAASLGSLLQGLPAGAPSTRVKTLVHSWAGFTFTLYLTHFTILTVAYEWKDPEMSWLLAGISIIAANCLACGLGLIGESRAPRLRQAIKSRCDLV